jgi:epidermal growth factor receptor substrate 15
MAQLFEGYWAQLDGSKNGEVNAITAAGFLKKSQLKESLLHKIWDLSDPKGKGYLDKEGFFTALRLVAACQCGREPSLKSIQPADPPPKFVGVENTQWNIDANERSMYNTRFERLQPINGLLSGEKVKAFLMSSQLPLEMLGKIWHLSDLDKDGSLDADEFAIAMKLITLVQKGETVPLALPPSMVPSTKAARLGLAPSVSMVTRSPSPIHGAAGSDWVVPPEVKAKYDTYFLGIDKDRDGIVNGEEARPLFVSSNLPQNILAKIWHLCDIDNNGKLNQEQFALAMYLISERVKGRELPTALTPQMIPPSKRKGTQQLAKSQPSFTSSITTSTPSTSTMNSSTSGITIGVTGGSTTGSSTSSVTSITAGMGVLSSPNLSFKPSQSQMAPSGGSMLLPSATPLIPLSGSVPTDATSGFSAIRDLDVMSNEVESIKKEKSQLQQDILMKQETLNKSREEGVSAKSELEGVMRERERLEQEKKMLEGQVEEMNNQRMKIESELQGLKDKCRIEKEEIDKLKEQLREQELARSREQDELSKLQQQFDDFKKEEDSLRARIATAANDLKRLQNEHSIVQGNIVQSTSQLNQYRQEERQLSDMLASLAGGTEAPPTMADLPGDLHPPNLLGEPDAISARATAGSSSPVSSISGFSTTSHQSEDRDRSDTITAHASDPFASFPDPFTGGTNTGGFPPIPTTGGGGDFSFDPFGLSNFKTTSSSNTQSSFATNFSGVFSSTPSVVKESSIVGSSAVTMTTTTSSAAKDPFSDPFGDPFSSSVTTPKAVDQNVTPSTSLWGSTPFSDPFSSSQTATDPFFSNDPFATGSIDPFADSNAFGGNSGFDPFASLTDTPPVTTATS